MKNRYILIFILSCCQAMAKPKKMAMTSPPTGFGVSNAIICSGTSSLLSATCASGIVNWFTSATGGGVIGTGSPFSDNPVATTAYYASCKDGISESSRAAGPTISVLADLAVGARIPQINLSGTLSNSDPTFRRTLAFSQGATCALSNIGTAVHYTTKTFTLATPSIVTVSLLSADGASLSPSGADTFIALYSSFNPTAVCTNIIAANDDAGAGAASKITTTTPLAAGTYTIVITSANNIPTNTNDAAFPWNFTAVVQASSIGVASAPSNLQANGGTNTFDICPTVSVTLTGSCANGTIKWYTSLTATTAVGSGSPLTIVPAVTTTYYASCENVCSASARVATQEITVTQLPDAPTNVSVSQAAVCFGTSITLSATCDAVPSSNINLTTNEKELFKAGLLNTSTPINNGTKTLKWYNQATGGTSIGTGTGLVITPTTNSSYYAACENACGSSPRVVKVVSVTPIPIAPTATGLSICSGKTASLSASCATGNIVWYSLATGLSGIVNNPFITPTLTTNTDYYVACESGGVINCASERTKVTVNINALPIPTTSTATPICSGTTLNLSSGNTGTSTSNTYAWSGVNAFTSSQQNPAITNATVSLTGTYQVVITNDQGCTALATTSVIVNPIPVIPTGTGGIINKGNSITLTATGCTGTLKWYETLNNNAVTMPVSPTIAIQYYAKCESIANGITCSSAKSNDVTVTVIYAVFVNVANANAPVQDGASWETAFGDLQAALATVQSGRQVWVAKGTYKPTTTITRTIYFNIPTNVKVYGGFMGTETLLEQRNNNTNLTILSGEIGNQAIQTDNSYHVVVFDGANANTCLDGFTITGGSANFDPKVNQTSNNASTETITTGGGITLRNASSPSIANCTLISNWGIFGGGIFAAEGSLPTITACKFLGNQASFGSGIYLLSGSNATITNTQISGNQGLGSVYCNVANPTIINCTIAGNGGTNGGVLNANSQPVISNSILWGNSPPFQSSNTQFSISNSIVEGGYSGTENYNINPQFVQPIDKQSAPSIGGDYHIISASIAIDRGDNGTVLLIDTDLDGNLRRYNGGKVDIGAYELQGNSTSNLIISAQTGDWEINSTWVGFKIPQISDIVIIDSNHVITINSTGIFKNINYRGSGQIKLKSSTVKLNLGF